MFYNVENYFDCRHDTLKSDLEFMPQGLRGWTPSRYYRKAGNIAKVVAAVGEDRFPEIVCLAEVENDACLRTLVAYSPLRNAGYTFVHLESPDPRGIDVCLLYDRFRFQCLGYEAFHQSLRNRPGDFTRDVLHVWGRVVQGDTLHVLVCHFPSRVGGALATEPLRREVAQRVRGVVDSLFRRDPLAKLMVVGDFNDGPTDRSLRDDLRALPPMPGKGVPGALYNLMLPLEGQSGSHKNQSEWLWLDQLLVSASLKGKAGDAQALRLPFLFESDPRWMGEKPFRTYQGMIYRGGFSDHLPVWVDLFF
jgi:hypothetical protein